MAEDVTISRHVPLSKPSGLICRLLSMFRMGILLFLSIGCTKLKITAEAEMSSCRLSSFRHRLSRTMNRLEQAYSQCGEDYNRRWPLLNVVNVDRYGAVGDGLTDDTQAFADAWIDACTLDSAILMIPYNKTYLVNHLEFKGPCGDSLVVELAGTLIAPSRPWRWNRSHSNAWLHFSHMNDLTVEGGGTLDGRGQQWWDQSCKRNRKKRCYHDAPTALRFSAVSNLMVRDLLSVNSPHIHIKFANCYGVQVANLQVDAPGDSPNTDGIHVSETQNVLIRDTWIGTGDDCISIVNGSADIKIQNISCGPGHGISIGSLGKGGSDDYVSLVVVDGAILTGTTNGVRIKTWPGGAGSVIGVAFQNVQMNNVSNPIIIDQKYCDSSSSCLANETSAVQVSQVWYSNISGTSATNQAIKLECSRVAPCKKLIFDNVNLVCEAGRDNTTAICENAQGFVVGTIFPPMGCLQLHAKAKRPLHLVK